MFPELETAATGAAVGATFAAPAAARSRRRPSIESLTYYKSLLELALLVLAVPWLLVRLIANPGRALRDAGEHHLR